MAHIDIFRNDAFGLVSMSTAIERIPYVPGTLGAMGTALFGIENIRTEYVDIEKREGKFRLLQTTQRGAPISQRKTEKRDIRVFKTRRIAEGDSIRSSEIQGIREFGTESELMQVQREVARRFGGPTGILSDVELTKENMRFGAVQGIVVDADGTVLDNWYTNWGATQAAEIDFALGTAGTKVRQKCQQVRRAMSTAVPGTWVPNQTQVHALCGDDFYDSLIDHPNVVSTYNNWAAAADLRENKEFSTFYYGGIFFHNFRANDPGSITVDKTGATANIAIASDKAKFFPVNAPGVFKEIYSPGESFEFVNTPGKPVYGMVLPDTKRNMFVDIEAYSYPLMICTAPAMLQRAKMA